MKSGSCRFCKSPLSHSFCNLGMTPFSNSYLSQQQLNEMEPFFPLHAYVCSSCFLVQLQEFQTPQQIFSHYSYFSSYSESWLKHAKAYAEKMTERFKLNSSSQVVEVASNDGYLLQFFKEKGIPVLGVEPAENVSKVAIGKEIPTLCKFFGVQTAQELAKEGKKADLLIGNNVLAHVPDLNDFVKGLKIALKPHGLITMEFPHLLQLMQENQFDTIYHEHFSYLSLIAVDKIFKHHGLNVFDIDLLPTHGGSLRIYAKHQEDKEKAIEPAVYELLKRETQEGLDQIETYHLFEEKVKQTKYSLINLLVDIKRQGKKIVGYGAPAKGNTLLNYCGVKTDFIDYTVDLSPHKQGFFLPGTHIPIYHPEKIRETKPDYLFILPWNLKDEIMKQTAFIREWGGKFLVSIPRAEVLH